MTSSETLAASEAFRARLSASLAERLAGLRVSAAEELALVPVLWRGRQVGRAAPACARSVGALPGARTEGAVLEPPDDLEAFGLTMRAVGLSQGWRGEALDLFELSGLSAPSEHAAPDRIPGAGPLGRIERALCRPLGALTQSVHLVGLARIPETVFDRVFFVGTRSAKKLVGPGLLDGLAAGMIAAGESPREALAREAAEEASLSGGDATLTLLGERLVSRPVRSGWMRERMTAAMAVLPEGFSPRPVDGEVERFDLVSADEALDLIEEGCMMSEAALALLLALERLLGGRRA